MTGLPFWQMPKRLIVDGVPYPIDTDFRVGIRIRQMTWDPYYERRPAALLDGICRLLFSGGAPAYRDETAFLAEVLWYLLDGRMPTRRIVGRLTDNGERTAAVRFAKAVNDGDAVFSYLWDMPAVYAAFLQVYRVDLLTAEMHLWQFDALFAALPEECTLRRTMAVRAAQTEDAADAEARAVLAAQKLAVRIPDNREIYESFYRCAE